ncbi:hypothetical protein [Flavobacterium sp. C3NV]|uniref:hypothetical protein n=1 Tax=Flavobacterium sp. C3NV TaxID=3393358 RepID=UPI00398F9AE9
MFTNISWSNYIIAVSVLLVIWYLILVFKFYYAELKQIISGEKKIKILSFGNRSKRNLSKPISSSFSESFDTLEDAEELSDRVLQVIEESTERNLSPTEFQNYLRLVLEEYPYVKISSLRENINNFIVSECEKHPQLPLTYEQVDSLWEETI